MAAPPTLDSAPQPTRGDYSHPTLPQSYVENGRYYHGFLRGRYLFPDDEMEKERLDIYHKLFLVARKEQLHQHQLLPRQYCEGPRKILDLGTGTGIWAIDMADRYQDAEVYAIDITNIQPPQIPGNMRIYFANLEAQWTGDWAVPNSFDLIHLRQGLGSYSDYSALYRRIFQHLKPGHGRVELVEIDLAPVCDDGSLPANSILQQWYKQLMQATEASGYPLAFQTNTRQLLHEAGFVEVQEAVINLPYNPWPKDLFMKDIGRWYSLGFCDALQALTMGPFTNTMNVTADAVNEWVNRVHKEVCTRKIHAYNRM